MYKILLTIFLMSTPFSSAAIELIADERVQSQSDCYRWIFTDYMSWRNGMADKYKRRAPTGDALNKMLEGFDATFGEEKFNYFKAQLDCRSFVYQVDGQNVNGYLIKPKSASEKLPVLIYNRGGNGNYGGVVFGSMMHNLFPIADRGFIIIGSQYRGTFTRDPILTDEFGGQDVNDVFELLKFIPNIDGADPDRIGMFGASRGGMQTFLALKRAKNIKAVATIAGNTDLIKGLTYRPEMENVYKHRIPNYEENKVVELQKRSVLNWVDQLSPNVPILLLHGAQDKRVSINHSIDLSAALTHYDIPHKFVSYEDDNHGLLANKVDVINELVTWFNTHL